MYLLRRRINECAPSSAGMPRSWDPGPLSHAETALYLNEVQDDDMVVVSSRFGVEGKHQDFVGYGKHVYIPEKCNAYWVKFADAESELEELSTALGALVLPSFKKETALFNGKRTSTVLVDSGITVGGMCLGIRQGTIGDYQWALDMLVANTGKELRSIARDVKIDLGKDDVSVFCRLARIASLRGDAAAELFSSNGEVMMNSEAADRHVHCGIHPIKMNDTKAVVILSREKAKDGLMGNRFPADYPVKHVPVCMMTTQDQGENYPMELVLDGLRFLSPSNSAGEGKVVLLSIPNDPCKSRQLDRGKFKSGVFQHATCDCAFEKHARRFGPNRGRWFLVRERILRLAACAVNGPIPARRLAFRIFGQVYERLCRNAGASNVVATIPRWRQHASCAPGPAWLQQG